MLHTKFQASEPMVLKEKIFEKNSMYFYGANLGRHQRDPQRNQYVFPHQR